MSQQSGSTQSCSEASSNESGSVPPTKPKSDFGKKHRKLVRILTVIAYMVSVSTAAVLLSAYYVFLWNPTSAESTEPPASLAMLVRQVEDPQIRKVLADFVKKSKPHITIYEQVVHCPSGNPEEMDHRPDEEADGNERNCTIRIIPLEKEDCGKQSIRTSNRLKHKGNRFYNSLKGLVPMIGGKSTNLKIGEGPGDAQLTKLAELDVALTVIGRSREVEPYFYHHAQEAEMMKEKSS